MATLAQDLTDLSRRGWRWWMGELASLVPAPIRRLASDAGPSVILSLDNGRLSLVKAARGQRDGPDPTAGATSEIDLLDRIALYAATTSARSGAPVPVRLRLAHAACLVRRIEVPKRALGDAQRIAELDLERSTPFKSDDVYVSHYAEAADSTRETGAIIQLIAKKAPIDDAITRLERAGLAVTAIDCWGNDGTEALPVDFLAANAAGRSSQASPARRRLKILTMLAAVLTASAVWISLARHQAALDQLTEQTTAARAKLAAITAGRGPGLEAAQDIEAVRRLKSVRPLTVSVIEELTRVLPDTAYLMELNADDDTVDITGFAKQAAGLVPLIEQSAMFTNATLSAPVTFDDSRDRERFGYRLRLRLPPESQNEQPSPVADPASGASP